MVGAKVRAYMTALLGGDERLCQALIPNYPVGCRRMTPAPGYLEAVRSQKTELITDRIVRATADGLVFASGREVKVDVIMCATGFDTSFVPRLPILGRRGNLQDVWRRELPKSYMSCAVDGMPNYFSEPLPS